MCGSDTLTTVVSSTSMKVANITAMATIQGLTCGTCALSDGIRTLVYFLAHAAPRAPAAAGKRPLEPARRAEITMKTGASYGVEEPGRTATIRSDYPVATAWRVVRRSALLRNGRPYHAHDPSVRCRRRAAYAGLLQPGSQCGEAALSGERQPVLRQRQVQGSRHHVCGRAAEGPLVGAGPLQAGAHLDQDGQPGRSGERASQ